MNDRPDKLIQQGIAEMQDVIESQYKEIERLHGRVKICTGEIEYLREQRDAAIQDYNDEIEKHN